MYLSSYIQVPDNPGKIVRRKKGENIYVLYEVARVYDPKRQFNVPKRVVIGKLASDAADAMMQPNEKFLQLFPESRNSLLELPSKRSNLKVTFWSHVFPRGWRNISRRRDITG